MDWKKLAAIILISGAIAFMMAASIEETRINRCIDNPLEVNCSSIL